LLNIRKPFHFIRTAHCQTDQNTRLRSWMQTNIPDLIGPPYLLAI